MSRSGGGGPEPGSIRVDRLLVYLRFARTRSGATALIASRALRCNRRHVLKGAEPVRIGDVLTLASGSRVRVIEVLALPTRRTGPAEALSHYREVGAGGLDPKGQIAIAASPLPGTSPPRDPEIPQ
jgi:ribosome-associated heat shock protein Hsp15